METTYVAALMGMERVGTGELVTMPMSESGRPPKRLYRKVVQGDEVVELVWEQWGDPDHSIYPYIFSGIEPVPAS